MQSFEEVDLNLQACRNAETTALCSSSIVAELTGAVQVGLTCRELGQPKVPGLGGSLPVRRPRSDCLTRPASWRRLAKGRGQRRDVGP